jgi:hypothetical protein
MWAECRSCIRLEHNGGQVFKRKTMSNERVALSLRHRMREKKAWHMDLSHSSKTDFVHRILHWAIAPESNGAPDTQLSFQES